MGERAGYKIIRAADWTWVSRWDWNYNFYLDPHLLGEFSKCLDKSRWTSRGQTLAWKSPIWIKWKWRGWAQFWVFRGRFTAELKKKKRLQQVGGLVLKGRWFWGNWKIRNGWRITLGKWESEWSGMMGDCSYKLSPFPWKCPTHFNCPKSCRYSCYSDKFHISVNGSE